MSDDDAETSVERPRTAVAWSVGAVVAICAALTLFIGLFPNWLFDLAARAVVKIG
jgi:NADH:ubiquinone oxidoreductase subunit 2 (subunit N)